MMTYGGVGSRDITLQEYDYLSRIAQFLRFHGFTLNSGHADGSDLAFEQGSYGASVTCDLPFEDRIFLPYKGFNRKRDATSLSINGCYIVPDLEKAVDLVRDVVPYLDNLKYDKKTGKVSFTYHAFLRNGYQVMGVDLNTPIKFLLCCSNWDNKGSVTGGTRVAYDLARVKGIPTFNLRYSEERVAFKEWFTTHHTK